MLSEERNVVTFRRHASQGSFQSSSQYATGSALEDTAESVQQGAIVQGSSVTESRRAPNSAFSWQEFMATRARSASPGLRRSPSPVRRISCEKKSATGRTCRGELHIRSGQVAQMRFAKRVLRRRRQLPKQKSAKGTIRSQAASFSAQAEASAAKALRIMEGRVRQFAQESGVHTSRVAEEVTQRLEAEINAAATSTAATAQTQMREAVEVMRRELQAQMEQNLAESRLQGTESAGNYEQNCVRVGSN